MLLTTDQIAKARVLTVRQPYAELIVRGRKRFETRGWRTHYRGMLFIHAAKRPARRAPAFGLPTHDLTFGAIIGLAWLTEVRPMNDAFMARLSGRERACGFYRPNWFAWRLREAVRFAPVECIGKEMLWRVPPLLVPVLANRLIQIQN